MIDRAIPVPPGLPSPDYIYSIFRTPWHVAPFVSRHSFATDWLPGCILAGGMFVGALTIAATAREARVVATARWLAFLLVYLFAALGLCYFDRKTGTLEKFYPFRPSSLLLLTWLVTVAAWLNKLMLRHPMLLQLVAGALVIPPFLMNTALSLRQDIKARAEIASDKAMIQDFLRGETPPDAVVLVDPEIDRLGTHHSSHLRHLALLIWRLWSIDYLPTVFHKHVTNIGVFGRLGKIV
jgi:hypothetical protein